MGFDTSCRGDEQKDVKTKPNVCPVISHTKCVAGLHGRHRGWDCCQVLPFDQQYMCFKV